MNIGAISLPGRRGITFMGGVAALMVVGVIEAPIALALAAVPIIDATVNRNSEDGRDPDGRTTSRPTSRSTSRRRTNPTANPRTASRRAPRRTRAAVAP